MITITVADNNVRNVAVSFLGLHFTRGESGSPREKRASGIFERAGQLSLIHIEKFRGMMSRESVSLRSYR